MLIDPVSCYCADISRGDEKRRLSVVSWNPKGKRKYGRIYGVQMLISVRYHEPLTLGNLGVTVANNFTK
jgi:hypothetical protein